MVSKRKRNTSFPTFVFPLFKDVRLCSSEGFRKRFVLATLVFIARTFLSLLLPSRLHLLQLVGKKNEATTCSLSSLQSVAFGESLANSAGDGAKRRHCVKSHLSVTLSAGHSVSHRAT